ncbi:hypothetical protein MMC22_007170 [Lobaria immixta]|nr:hypothetical protein [Lobaria immixta]
MWMRTVDVAPIDPLVVAGPQRPSKIFILSLDRTVNTRYEKELTEHEEQFVAYECLQLPPQTVTLSKDPRDFHSGTMFRDALRRALKFEDTRVDILWILFSFEPVRRSFDFRDESLHVPWEEFVHAINSSAQNTITFSYALRVVEGVEFEYSGPPLALMDEFFKPDNNDVARTVHKTDDNDVARDEEIARMG